MKEHLAKLLIACAAVVSFDKPTPCDKAAILRATLEWDMQQCQSNVCAEWTLKRAEDANKACAGYLGERK